MNDLVAGGTHEPILCHAVDVSSDPKYSRLTDAEKSWLAGMLDHARSVGANPEDPGSIGVYFDSAVSAVETGAEDSEIGNSVVNTVGIALGEYLRTAVGLEWQILTDEIGSELCLYRPAMAWTLFPQSSAAKRWEAHEKNWVVPFCERVLELSQQNMLEPN